jgi:hypothetical protein
MQQKVTAVSKQPEAAPAPKQMIMFSCCPHKFEQPSGPALHNPNTKFDEKDNIFTQPSLCWNCDVIQYQNRQELIMADWATKERQQFEELIDTAVQEFDNERDRNEYLLIHKTRIQADLSIKRDTEVLLMWGRYVDIWINSIRVENGQTAVLSIDLQRDTSSINVKHIWKLQGTDEVLSSNTVSTTAPTPAQAPPAPTKPVVKGPQKPGKPRR